MNNNERCCRGGDGSSIACTPDTCCTIRRDQLDAALEAHIKWKDRFTAQALCGDIDQSVEEIRCSTNCPLGLLLSGPKMSKVRKCSTFYLPLIMLHEKFHSVAATIAQRVGDKDIEGAEKLLYGELSDLSVDIGSIIYAWESNVHHVPYPQTNKGSA